MDNFTDDNEDDEEESGTPRLVVNNKKRPSGRKQEKERVKKGGYGVVFQSAVQEMITTRKEMEANKKSKESRWMEVKVMEERKLAIEEEKLRMEQEYKIMFMDTSRLNQTQRAYLESMRAQILSRMVGSGSGNGSV
uniref:No apical meristem-associated C-terminal domain-containing protein n=1 Tax=Setaria italica TaxID=4555 RepID=K3XQS8_SETIT